MRILLLLMLFIFGCGHANYKDFNAATTQMELAASDMATMGATTGEADAAGGEADSAAAIPLSKALQRKIIYTAEIDLVVEQFDPLPNEVQKLAERFKGYVARSNIAGSPGSPRSGQWTIRVPVERYQEFLEAARGLGEVRRESADSEDVSEEYYDLTSRIRNKKKAEQRLLELLADATGKLDEILSVERELARVREEIERMEGRMRVLDDLTALTTVTVRVDEIKNYVPEEAAGYTTRLRRSFANSVDSLNATAQNASIAVIVALPWLGVLLVPLIALAALVRIRRRRKRG